MAQRENKNKTRSHTRTRVGSTPMHVQTLVNKDFNRRPSEMERDKKMNEAVIGSDSNPAWDGTNEQQPELDKAAVDVQQIMDRLRTADPTELPNIVTGETIQALKQSKKGQILRRGKRVAEELEGKGQQRVEDLKKQLMSKESAEKIAARRLTKELGNLELDDIIRLFGRDVSPDDAASLAGLVREGKLTPNQMNSLMTTGEFGSGQAAKDVMDALGMEQTGESFRAIKDKFRSRPGAGPKGLEGTPGGMLPKRLTDEQVDRLNAIRARRGAEPVEASDVPVRNIIGGPGTDRSDLLQPWHAEDIPISRGSQEMRKLRGARDLAEEMGMSTSGVEDAMRATQAQTDRGVRATEYLGLSPSKRLAANLPEAAPGSEAEMIQQVLRGVRPSGELGGARGMAAKKDFEEAFRRGEDPIAQRVARHGEIKEQLKPGEQALRDLETIRVGTGKYLYDQPVVDTDFLERARPLSESLRPVRAGQFVDNPEALQDILSQGQQLQEMVRTPLAFQRGVKAAKKPDLSGTGVGPATPRQQTALDEFVEAGRKQRSGRARKREAEELEKSLRTAPEPDVSQTVFGIPSQGAPAPVSPFPPQNPRSVADVAPPPSPGGADVIDMASRRGSRVLDDRELAKQPGMLRTEADLDEFMMGPSRNVDDALSQKNQQLDQTASKVQDTEQRIATTGGPLGAGGKPGPDPTPVGATPPQPDPNLQPKSNFARNAMIGSAIAVPTIAAGAYGVHRFNKNIRNAQQAQQQPQPQPQQPLPQPQPQPPR